MAKKTVLIKNRDNFLAEKYRINPIYLSEPPKDKVNRYRNVMLGGFGLIAVGGYNITILTIFKY